MTPKEKAIELVEKFKIDNYDWIAQGSNVTAKKHALICINEIIDFRKKLYFTNHNSSGHKYLLEIKTEIKNL